MPKRLPSFQRLGAVLTILVVAGIGTYLISGGHADTPAPFVSTTADKGSLAAPATNQTCSGASDNNNCVQFGTPPAMDGNVLLALSSPGAPFAASSFWNTPLPDNTAISVNNSDYQTDLQYDLCNYFPVEKGTSSQPGYPCVVPSYGALNNSAFSIPLYIVPSNQPLVPVNAACANPKAGTNFTPPTNLEQNVLANGVPIPSDASGATGTDEDVVIYQPSTNTEWELWQFQKDSNNNWEACDAGINTNVSGSNGSFTPPYGLSASGLSKLASTPRVDELRAGQIDHAVGLTLPIRLSKNTAPANACTVVPAGAPCATTGFSYPANRTDGASTDPTEIAEGQRLRLPANLDLSQYNPSNPNATTPLTPLGYAIAVAVQKYGFIVDDGGGAVGIQLGDSAPYIAAGLPDPYSSGLGVGGINDGNTGLFAGKQSYLVMKNFPWNLLQALPFNYGQPD